MSDRTDVEIDVEDEYDPEEDESGNGEVETTQATTGSFGRTFQQLPEGFCTAGGFAKVLKAKRGVDVRPQVLYATAKNTKTFPAIRHTDGRIIVNEADALAWWDEKDKRVASRAGGPRSMEPTAYMKAQAAKAASESTDS